MTYSVEYLCALEYVRRVTAGGKEYEPAFPMADQFPLEVLNDPKRNCPDVSYHFLERVADAMNQGLDVFQVSFEDSSGEENQNASAAEECTERSSGIEENTNRQKKKANMNKAIICIIAVAIAVVGGIWISGCAEASRLVKEGNASIFTVGIKTNSMSGLKKSGFMFYINNFTDYDSLLSDLVDIFD